MKEEYYHTKESVDEYINMAEGYDGRDIIYKLKHFLPHNSTLLEVGSGPGTDFDMLNEAYRVIGSDLSEEFLYRLIIKHSENKFIKLDAVTLETKLHFDAIYANKVFQHLTDDEIKQSIKRQLEILNPEGMICFTFWEGTGQDTHEGMLVNYQSEENLKSLFEENFEILLLEKYKEFENDDSILIIAKKK